MSGHTRQEEEEEAYQATKDKKSNRVDLQPVCQSGEVLTL